MGKLWRRGGELYRDKISIPVKNWKRLRTCIQLGEDGFGFRKKRSRKHKGIKREKETWRRQKTGHTIGIVIESVPECLKGGNRQLQRTGQKKTA